MTTQDAFHRTFTQQHGNQARTTTVYDAVGQIAVLRQADGLLTERRTTYTHDAVQRRTTARVGSTRTTWLYDAAGQLKDELRTGGSNPGAYGFDYDANGNRIQQRINSDKVNYFYDAANQLTSRSDGTTYEYDACGNRLEEETTAKTTFYTWDAQNRPAVIEPVGDPVSLTYDALDRRVTKTVRGTTTQFLYDAEHLLPRLERPTLTSPKLFLAC